MRDTDQLTSPRRHWCLLHPHAALSWERPRGWAVVTQLGGPSVPDVLPWRVALGTGGWE